MSDSWAARPCLVTGAAGFGGAHLCEHLVARGAKVYALDRRLPRSSYLRLSGTLDRLDFIPGDIRDESLIKLTLDRHSIDTVFHLAAQPIVPVSNAQPLDTLSVNALGTYTMLEAARCASRPPRFIFASSGAYYGASTTDEPIDEERPPMPATNIYAPSKVAGDVAVRGYAKTFGLRAAACRFMNTYGPADTHFSRIVPRAIEHLLRETPYDFGERDDGTTRLDYLHVSDMTRGYLAVAERIDEVAGEAFNFGSGRAVATAELVRSISRLFDGKSREPHFRGPAKKTPSVKYLDIGKSEELLGWRPQIDLEAGLGATIKWYRELWDRL